MQVQFNEANVNQNGVLNKGEYATFRRASDGWQKVRYGDADQATIDLEYMLTNNINPEREGLSLNDIIK